MTGKGSPGHLPEQPRNAATGRTSALSVEIRVPKFSQHISPTATFCTSQRGLLRHPESAILLRGQADCVIGYKTSLRNIIQKTSTRIFRQQHGGLRCGQLSCFPSPARFGDDHLSSYLMKLHPETHVLEGDHNGALRVGLQAGGRQCLTRRFHVYQEREKTVTSDRREGSRHGAAPSC